MKKILSLLIFTIFLFSISAAEEKIIFEFTENELSELQVRKVRGADAKTIYTIGKNENGFIFNSNDEVSFKKALGEFIISSKDSINKKLINAKKRSKLYTCFYNSKKLSNIINEN